MIKHDNIQKSVLSLLVIPKKDRKYTIKIKAKNVIKRSIEMIKNEDYVLLLRSMISCINNGDYYSIKELSHLKLEQIKEDERKIKNK